MPHYHQPDSKFNTNKVNIVMNSAIIQSFLFLHSSILKTSNNNENINSKKGKRTCFVLLCAILWKPAQSLANTADVLFAASHPVPSSQLQLYFCQTPCCCCTLTEGRLVNVQSTHTREEKMNGTQEKATLVTVNNPNWGGCAFSKVCAPADKCEELD